jgi:hypothetical protein
MTDKLLERLGPYFFEDEGKLMRETSKMLGRVKCQNIEKHILH